jgi:hypothetical protein
MLIVGREAITTIIRTRRSNQAFPVKPVQID